MAVLPLVALLLMLWCYATGDEGRQPVDLASTFGRPATLRRALLVTMMLLGLRIRLRVAREKGLRLAGPIGLVTGSQPRLLALVVAAILESFLA
jgi:hypothetical protein